MGRSSTRCLLAQSGPEKGKRGPFGHVVSIKLVVVASLFLVALLSGSISAPASSATSTPASAEVSVLSTNAYGSVLVVGNGALKGFPLYAFSGDQGGKIRCGTSLATGYDLGPITTMPLTCTGPESDLLKGVKSDDWPAFTSAGPPLAGPGINSRLLSRVDRLGIGGQVTYNGHPLYLFDPVSQPFVPQGEGYMETTKPLAPWHGYWFLISTSGNIAPARATLDQGVLPDGSTVLSVIMDADVSPLDVTLYTFSGGQSRVIVCGEKCSLTWIPLLTHGTPAVGHDVNPRLVGTHRLSNGTEQVTYRGQPLFLYAKEKVFLTPSVHLKSSGTAGNGSGVRVPGDGSSVTIVLH
jgi:predicted lipoprotein with Yx(FWY)xxD motif